MSHPIRTYRRRSKQKRVALYGIERRLEQLRRIKRSRFWNSMIKHAVKRGAQWVRFEVVDKS